MIELITRARGALFGIHPLVLVGFYAAICFATFYAIRRWLPGLWNRLERTIPEGVNEPISNILLGLPSVAFGAALDAFLNGGPQTPMAAFWGAAGGTLAPVAHHILKALPVPYRGPVRDLAWKVARKAGLVSMLVLAGCTSTLTPDRQAERQLCLASVELEFNRESDKLCPPDEVYWDDCVHAVELENKLEAAQRECSRKAHL